MMYNPDNHHRRSPVGEIANKYWNEILEHFNNFELDEYVIMPNHIHGILIINEVAVQNLEPLPIPNNKSIHRYQHIIPRSIGPVIRSFKSSVTHWCKQNGFKNFRWQRNFYEHIIRDENELTRIRKYINENPLKWDSDKENITETGSW